MRSTATPLGRRLPWRVCANPAGAPAARSLAGTSTWTDPAALASPPLAANSTGTPGWGVSSATGGWLR